MAVMIGGGTVGVALVDMWLNINTLLTFYNGVIL